MASTTSTTTALSVSYSFLVSVFVLLFLLFLASQFPDFISPGNLEYSPVFVKYGVVLLFASIVSYLLSLAFSYFNQVHSCDSADMSKIAVSNLLIPASVGATSAWLLLENLPLKGAPSIPPTFEELEKQPNQNSFQFLLKLVQDVLPETWNHSQKEAVAYMYWIFWATLLPSHFVMKLQSLC